MKTLKSRLNTVVTAILSTIGHVATAITANYNTKPRVLNKQAGFVSLSRPYAGYPAGRIVELPASTEAALIAAGGAVASAGPATAGNATTTAWQGSVTFAAGFNLVVLTNAFIKPQSILFATIAQDTPDTTAQYVARVVCGDGFANIYTNASATAATMVDWAIINPTGTLTSPT